MTKTADLQGRPAIRTYPTISSVCPPLTVFPGQSRIGGK